MTRESTQKSLIFNTKTKGENYNEENKKLKKCDDTLFFECRCEASFLSLG